MGHHMKGNIGIFISQGQFVMIKDNKIQNVVNHGLNENEQLSEASGILLTGSNHVVISENKIMDIQSDNSSAESIRYKNENNNIIVI